MAPDTSRNPRSLANLKPKWPKGTSGNPAGRAPVPRSVVEAARAESLDSIRTLAAIRDDERQPTAIRAAACCALLDRAWGKPGQSISVKEEVPTSPLDFRSLSEDELLTMEALLDKAFPPAHQDIASRELVG